MLCRICQSLTIPQFSRVVAGKYQREFLLCENCGFLQMDDLSHMNEVYSRPINHSDVGLMARNLRFVEQLTPLFYFQEDRNGRFLDYGGGYGVFARMMRDNGFDFYWNDRYAENLFAAGFEAQLSGRFAAVTALELFEHLADPMALLEEMFECTDTVIIGTNLSDGCFGKLELWHYLGCEHGQHVGFFAMDTMNYMARILGVHAYGDCRYLTILSRKKPGFLSRQIPRLRHRYSVILNEYVKSKMTSRIEADYSKAVSSDETII